MKKMKSILTLIFSFVALAASAQVVVVDLRDNDRLQWSGEAVKQRGTIHMFTFSREGDFTVGVTIAYYVNNGGAYGSKITDVIAGDSELNADQKNDLLSKFADRYFEHSTAGKFVNPANGDIVAQGTPGAVTELSYWQGFNLNQVPGVGTVANTKAMNAMYFTVIAIVNRMNLRKNW